MAEHTRERRVAAMRGSERMLSGVRPMTMRERLAELDPGDDRMPDFYGDGFVGALEERVAGLLGTEAAVFFPTGTMAQQIAVRYGGPRVALHPISHPEQHERHAFSRLSGLRVVSPTREPRNANAEEITDLDEDVDTVMLELPLRDAGFVLPTWDELVATADAVRARGARVHFDGARIWETTEHFGHSLPEIAGLADSVYVSFYKSLGGISGAALAGTRHLAAFARAWRDRYGGTLFQQWPAALAAERGLDEVLPRLPDYVRHARTVAAVLGELPGAKVNPAPPHTHQFQLWLPHPADRLDDAALALAEKEKVWFAAGWADRVPGLAMTELTVAAPATELTAADVRDIADRFVARL